MCVQTPHPGCSHMRYVCSWMNTCAHPQCHPFRAHTHISCHHKISIIIIILKIYIRVYIISVGDGSGQDVPEKLEEGLQKLHHPGGGGQPHLCPLDVAGWWHRRWFPSTGTGLSICFFFFGLYHLPAWSPKSAVRTVEFRHHQVPSQQPRTPNELPTGLWCRSFVSKHRLSNYYTLVPKHAKKSVCIVYMSQLSFLFCIPPLVVGLVARVKSEKHPLL